MSPLLSRTQIASWHNVSETTVARMAKDGRLPQPMLNGTRPCFSADVILPQILQDGDVRFAGGVTLTTLEGPVYFEVIEARYKLDLFDERWAVFETLDGTWHIRAWRTAFFLDLPRQLGHWPIILSCECDQIDEFPVDKLHCDEEPIFSAPDGFYERLTFGFWPRPSEGVSGTLPMR